MKSRKNWRAVIINDLHNNHNYGLSRPGMILRSGGRIPSTPWREWLWGSWLDFCDYANQEEINKIVYNGDTADGFNDKSAGIGSWSPDKEDWKNAFQDTHMELTKRRKVEKTVITMGSGFHTGSQRGINMDEECASKINAEYHPTYDLELGGFWFKVQHQSGGVSLINPESALQRELRNQAEFQRQLIQTLNEQFELYGKGYDGLFLGHVHFYSEIRKTGWVGVINGCWQGKTDYMIRKSAILQPHIGGIIIDVVEGRRHPNIEWVSYPIPPHLWTTLDQEEILRIEERRKNTQSSFDRSAVVAYQNTLQRVQPGKEVEYKAQGIHKGVAKKSFTRSKEKKFKVQKIHERRKMK